MLLSMLLPDRLRVSEKFLNSPVLWIRDRLRERIRLLALAERIKSERRALSKLSDIELRDIGIHRADADAELERSFWDLPDDRVNRLDK